jgi:hypothetical protein
MHKNEQCSETMQKYLYTVWFRDKSAAIEDQDREWPACFVIKAESSSDAKSWGDHLAKNYCIRHTNEEFLYSDALLASNSEVLSEIEIECGSEVDDYLIGW